MSFYTRIELEQIRNSREYVDQLLSGQSAESGIDFNSDFNYAISALRRVIYGNASGTGKWYDAVPASLTTLNDASGILKGLIDQNDTDIDNNYADFTNASGIWSSDISNIQTDVVEINSFIGRSDGDLQPTYTSSSYVTQSGSLEQAIGELDNAITTAGIGAETWTQVFNNGSGILDGTNYDIDMQIGSGKSFHLKDSNGNSIYQLDDTNNSVRQLGRRYRRKLPTTINAGSTMTLPGSINYTVDSEFRNLHIFRNGTLLIPGSGVISSDEDFGHYRELNSTQVVINVKIRATEVIDIRSFG